MGTKILFMSKLGTYAIVILILLLLAGFVYLLYKEKVRRDKAKAKAAERKRIREEALAKKRVQEEADYRQSVREQTKAHQARRDKGEEAEEVAFRTREEIRKETREADLDTLRLGRLNITGKHAFGNDQEEETQEAAPKAAEAEAPSYEVPESEASEAAEAASEEVKEAPAAEAVAVPTLTKTLPVQDETTAEELSFGEEEFAEEIAEEAADIAETADVIAEAAEPAEPAVGEAKAAVETAVEAAPVVEEIPAEAPVEAAAQVEVSPAIEVAAEAPSVAEVPVEIAPVEQAPVEEVKATEVPEATKVVGTVSAEINEAEAVPEVTKVMETVSEETKVVEAAVSEEAAVAAPVEAVEEIVQEEAPEPDDITRVIPVPAVKSAPEEASSTSREKAEAPAKKPSEDAPVEGEKTMKLRSLEAIPEDQLTASQKLDREALRREKDKYAALLAETEEDLDELDDEEFEEEEEGKRSKVRIFLWILAALLTLFCVGAILYLMFGSFLSRGAFAPSSVQAVAQSICTGLRL